VKWTSVSPVRKFFISAFGTLDRTVVCDSLNGVQRRADTHQPVDVRECQFIRCELSIAKQLAEFWNRLKQNFVIGDHQYDPGTL
jgi:hypothetical protein